MHRNSTRSLYDTDMMYFELHRRRYCKNYYMPIDEDEQTRMQLFHDLFYHLLGKRLTTVPLVDPKRILDVGTGVGEWAMDMGETYPNAEVIGTDIARIQPRSVPLDNTFFEIEDAEADGGWAWPEDYFDMVHYRYMYGAFRSWPYIYRETFTHLAPGGWIEVLEFDCEDSMGSYMNDETGFPEWLGTVVEATRRSGMLWTNEHLYPRILEDIGFVDVHLTSIDIPIGVWPEDEETRRSGKHFLVSFMLGLEAICLRVLTEQMGWTADQVRVTCENIAAEVWRIALDPVRSKGFTFKLKVLVGRKPGGPDAYGSKPPVYSWPPRTSSKAR
jgi:SAM-dependent methyltransferase